MVSSEGDLASENVIDYPEITSLSEINTQSNMFYYGNVVETDFRFGRNLSGYYQFKLNLPKEYQYEIYTVSDYSSINNDDETWVLNNKLRLISSYLSNEEDLNLGYYYFIKSSPRFRTRYFTIVIKDIEPKPNWGLTDKG